MINRRFKIGDQVRFTQEAKDRFDDDEYWHYANYDKINLNKDYTVKSVDNKNQPTVSLGEGTAPYTPTYLLKLAEIQKNMQKKDFILALVQAIFPDCKSTLTYSSCCPYAKVHIGSDNITVKCNKDKKTGNVSLTLSSGDINFIETDIELVTEFLDQRCDLDCPEDAIKVTDNGDLVMHSDDYLWHLVDEIKPLKQSPAKEDSEQIQALQAEIQQLKAENERLKAQTYTIEIPQGVTSICLNLKG